MYDANDPAYDEARAFDQAPHLRPYLKLTGSLEADSNTVIETDEGLKLRIKYGNQSRVFYYPVDAGAPIEGVVLSGSDWTLLRSDGVLVFDSRITLQFGQAADRAAGIKAKDLYLLDCTLSGMVDLARVVNARDLKDDEQIFDAVVRGDYTGKNWDVALRARFEGSAGPARQEDTSWLPDSLLGATAEFPKYRQLVRQELSVYGKVYVEKKPYFPATKISLTMWGSK